MILGKFRLIDRIAETRNSIVYCAERIGDFAQRVAVKIPRQKSSPCNEESACAKLRDLQQVLGRLHHASIAALVDSCLDSSSPPWLATEFVDGVPLDQYCASRSLPFTEIIALFCQVLSAVDYAHQHLVVHGGLTFDRILVDADGEPHLIGFRPAEELIASEVAPAHEELLFASPEQMQGQTLTAATDVYCAAVLLVMLLTGRHPFEEQRHDEEVLAHAIRGQQPMPPSVRCGGILRRRMRGDLDAIAQRALATQPELRYPGVAAFVNDLRSYLSGMPVQARGGGTFYKIDRFARRNRMISGAVATLVLILAGSGMAIARQEVQARQARIESQARLHDMQRLTDSLLGQFSADLEQIPGSEQVEDLLLRRAAATIDEMATEAAGDPVLRDELAGEYLRLAGILNRRGHFVEGSHAACKGLALLGKLPNRAGNLRELQEQLTRLQSAH